MEKKNENDVESIAAQALSHPNPAMVKYAVITGTPGIRKSVMFAFYAMWELIQAKKRVLFLMGKTRQLVTLMAKRCGICDPLAIC